MRAITSTLIVLAACSGKSSQAPASRGAVPPASPAQVATTSTSGLPGTVEAQLVPFDSVVVIARNELSKHPTTPAADSVLMGLRDRYMRLAGSLTDRISDDTAEDLALGNKSASDSLRRVLAAHGFKLNFTEGSSFVDESSAFFLQVGGAFITPGMKEFLSIRSAEERTRFSEDAALEIPWDSVAERVARWDAFLQRYPSFAFRAAAAYMRATYLATYLTGMDNTRTRTDSGSLEPDVLTSYQSYLRRHPRDSSAAVVRDYIALFGAGATPSDSSVQAFLHSHHLDSMLGVQPFTN